MFCSIMARDMNTHRDKDRCPCRQGGFSRLLTGTVSVCIYIYINIYTYVYTVNTDPDIEEPMQSKNYINDSIAVPQRNK